MSDRQLLHHRGKYYKCYAGRDLGLTHPGKGYKRALLPMLCKTWDCEDCGKVKQADVIHSLIAGWQARWPGILPLTFTFTYRGIGRKGDLEKFGRERAIELGLARNPPALTLKRWQQSPSEWADYVNAQWTKLTLDFEREWGQRLHYWLVPQWTALGVPHLHVVVPSMYGAVAELNVWFTMKWLQLNPDGELAYAVKVTDPTTRTLSGSGAKVKTVRQALWYAGRYLVDPNKLDAPTKEWRSAFKRRFRASSKRKDGEGFPKAIAIDADRVRDGFNAWVYRRLYGRAYKALVQLEDGSFKPKRLAAMRAAIYEWRKYKRFYRSTEWDYQLWPGPGVLDVPEDFFDTVYQLQDGRIVRP